jgi:hypothetical protein
MLLSKAILSPSMDAKSLIVSTLAVALSAVLKTNRRARLTPEGVVSGGAR